MRGEAEADRDDQADDGQRTGAGARHPEGKQHRRGAPYRGASGSQQPAVLLTARVVHCAPLFGYATPWGHVDGGGSPLLRLSTPLSRPQLRQRSRRWVENGAIGEGRAQLHTPAGPTTTPVPAAVTSARRAPSSGGASNALPRPLAPKRRSP